MGKDRIQLNLESASEERNALLNAGHHLYKQMQFVTRFDLGAATSHRVRRREHELDCQLPCSTTKASRPGTYHAIGLYKIPLLTGSVLLHGSNYAPDERE